MIDAPTGSGPSLEALDTTRVLLTGVRPASELLPGLGPRRFLHSGPPLTLDEAPGPMRGAIIGGLVLEGEAAGVDQAAAILAAGEVELASCNEAGAVGAMAGIVTPSMPVVAAESEDGALRACSPINEGLGQALRFGSYDDATLQRLRWLARVAGPLLDDAIRASDPIELTELIPEGLRRGDECHNRNVATSAMLIARLAPAIVRGARDRDAAGDVLTYAAGNRHFGLPFSMVMAKVVTQAAHARGGDSIVTTMAGNGVRFGIRVRGTGDRWFTAPAPVGEPRLFDGFTKADAQPLMGDSMVTEAAGFGAFALTAAPAIVSFIGGTMATARDTVDEMRRICVGESRRLLVPGDDFRGTPIGIDVDLVARTGIAPVVDNGFAHRDAGAGQVGAGITRLPVEPFAEAAAVLRARDPVPEGAT